MFSGHIPSYHRSHNESIDTCVFPSTWKIAKVKAAFKGGTECDMDNYRPLSILCVLSKLLEMHVQSHLTMYMEKYKLFSDCQSGFCRNHSCQTTLTSMTNKWLNAINDGQLVGCVALDLKKAFNVLNHNLLYKKLYQYRCSSSTIQWFQSCLKDRDQFVLLQNCASEKQKIKDGVPQGSFLGPLLFSIYINDLPLFLSDASIDLYADDSTIYTVGQTINDIESTHNSQLKVF